MKVPHKAHVAVVDGNRFVLMRNVGTLFEPELETLETPDIDPTNFSAGVRHQDPVGQLLGRTDLNELAFAAGVAEWLNHAVLGNRIEKLVIIADPKSLGEMRRHYHKELGKALVGEIDKALTGEPNARIAKILSAA